jgi:hypothetical protein
MQIDKSRIGQFFLALGLFLLIIFLATDQSQHPQFGLFFFAAFSLAGGIYLFLRFRKPPIPSERFRAVRKYVQKRKENQPKRKKK